MLHPKMPSSENMPSLMVFLSSNLRNNIYIYKYRKIQKK